MSINGNKNIIRATQAEKQQWDFIIVGAGMGGGTAAYKLASKGKKVLLIEKGKQDVTRQSGVEVEGESETERLESGKWPTQLSASINGTTSKIWAPLGCGTGGSSLLYAASLQRLRPEDFDKQLLPDGSTIEWPFSYEEISSYYQEAEQVYSVCGTKDPLHKEANEKLLAPPAMCDLDRHYFSKFQEFGLNPYRLHVGIKYKKDCIECGGFICKKECKQDANSACISLARESGNLYTLPETEVIKINADKKSVQNLIIKNENKHFQINAQTYILSAGAFFTPVLLQNSKNQYWPNGVANSSGLVGSNLMFHASDFIAVWPKDKLNGTYPRKNIAIRDYYRYQGKSLGEFQSTGLDVGYGHIVYALRLMFDQSRLKKLTFLRHFLRIPAFLAYKLFGKASIFTTIVEDYPYKENRVIADDSQPSGMRFEYTIYPEFKERVLLFRKTIQKAITQLKCLPMGTSISLNFGHPCGTCKAGNDAKNSVVDTNCKTHDLDNLYIVDSSIMPTSGGTNPSLTIAANALRVADRISELQT